MFAEMFHQAAATRLSTRFSLSLSVSHSGTTPLLIVCTKNPASRLSPHRSGGDAAPLPDSDPSSEKDDGRPPLVSSISTFSRLAAAIVTAVSGGRNASRL